MNHWQIANHIYGHNGKGPFLDTNGSILSDKLDQEEKEPGSVVPADWIPEQEKIRLEMHNVDVQKRIQALEGKAEAAAKPQESVEGLLREKQFPDVIAKVCGVTEEQVRKVAEALDIPVNIRPNLAAERSPYEKDINPEAAAAMDASRQTTGGATGEGRKPEADRAAPKGKAADFKDDILEMHARDPKLGAADIARELKLPGKEALKVAQILQEASKAGV